MLTRVHSTLPPEVEPIAAAVMPQSFTLHGLSVGFGDALREDYSRAVRPFADAGLSHNSLVGRGYNFRIGAAGSVLGGDHLSIYMNVSKGARASGDIVREIGVAYRW